MPLHRLTTTVLVAVTMFGPLAVRAVAQDVRSQDAPSPEVPAQDTVSPAAQENPSALVVSRPSIKSPTLLTASPGTLLEVLDQEGEWYWVLLPPNPRGSRFAGWIHSADTDKGASTHNRFVMVTPRPPAPKPQPKEEKPEEERTEEKPKVDERRLKKAEQELEQARRELEKLTVEAPAAQAPTPDPIGHEPTP